MKISKALLKIVKRNIRQWQKDADESFLVRQELDRKLANY